MTLWPLTVPAWVVDLAVVLFALEVARLGLDALFDYFERVDAAARAERRRRRVVADREIVNGEEPLPPGVSLSDAYAYGARHDLPLAEAAWEIHRAETLAILRKALRRPRPGD